MATDFFERQDQARQRTFMLLVWFILAVIALILVAYVIIDVILFFKAGQADQRSFQWWNPALFVGTTAIMGALVLGGGGFKIMELASGGSAVALMLGGKEIPMNTSAAKEKRLLNIVEEMAIASGVPVPPCYILPDEKGINAFAAGYTNGDAVVAVSQGSLDYLTRDELQGVIAHEFSHILNGDMKINIRLIGIIYGILVLSIVGEIVMRSASRTSSSNNKDNGRMVALLIGLALYLLGLGGVFFGNLIQAAVSRQREYLADASAVQFTRNPLGISGALKKIGGLSEGATIRNGNASEVAHMFFADGLVSHLGRMFATHPPLEERIRILDPQWDGNYPEVVPSTVSPQEEKAKTIKKSGSIIPGLPEMPGTKQIPIPVVLGLAEENIQKVGSVTREMADQAGALLNELPDLLRKTAADPFGARFLILAMLLDNRNTEIRSNQMVAIQSIFESADLNELSKLESAERALASDLRLPLANLAVPALRQLSPRQYKEFREVVQKLIEADGNIDPFERGLADLLTTHLDRAFGLLKSPRSSGVSSIALAPQANQIISSLAWAGKEGDDVQSAFRMGMEAYVGQTSEYELIKKDQLPKLKTSLEPFREASADIKRRLLRAALVCVLADGKIVLEELERVRLIAAMLEVPLPPLHLGEQSHSADSILAGKI
jgi:Zn-dependent protease with chaperone function